MITNMPDGYIAIKYDRILKERTLAIFVDFGFTREWIPESQIYDRFEDGDGKTLIMTEWIAGKKKLI